MELVKSYYKYDGHDFDAGLVRESLEDLIKKSLLGRVWFIDLIDANHAKNKNIGYIILTFGYSLEFHGRNAFIDEFFIVETMRGKGLGKKAIELVLQKAKPFKINAIHLEVVTANLDAYEFYSKIGFIDRSHHLLTKKI